MEDIDEPQPPPQTDLTSKVIGDFGKWQLKISILMSLLRLPNAWFQLNIVFMAPPQDFWCEKPPNLKMSEELWRNICAPRMEERPCLIFDPDILGALPDIDKSLVPLVMCKKFVYDNSVFKRTITSDWDLVCSQHWYIHLTQSVVMMGVLVGSLIFGKLADSYGRKTPIMVAICLQAIFAFIASLMPTYWIFLTLWFVVALGSGGITIISFVICLEAVGGKYRTTVPIIYQMPFFLGNVVMAVLAHYLRDWRKLDITLASLSAVYIAYWFFIPESPRWLLATGRHEEAIVILKDIAAYNNRPYNEPEIRGLLLWKKVTNLKKRKDPEFKDFFVAKKMRIKTLLLSIIWFFSGLSFYTFSQYLSAIGGNIFFTIGITGIISCFGAIICVFTITKMGRKKTVGVYQLVTAVCFVLLLVLPSNWYKDWPRLLCAGIGFAGMAGSIPALYLYSGELFPTLGRNVGIGGVTMFARIASMTAPLVLSLEYVNANLPLILMTIMSLTQLFLLIPLPETNDRPLPETMEEAEMF